MQNCFANWHLILEYLKVLFSWPPMVLALVALLLPTFGVPISNLLKSVRKGKAVGIEFEIEADQQKSPAPPAPDDGDHLGKLAADPVTAKAEIIRWWRAAADEHNFHKIYGTQIRLLEHLANQPGASDNENALMAFHLEHLKLVEAANNPVVPGYWTQYLGFLLSAAYIVRSNTPGEITLSPLGEQFLKYIRETWGAYASTRAL